MTRDEAEQFLAETGSVGDGAFPLLEAAIACAEHDCPFRDPEPVRVLGRAAADRLRLPPALASPEEAPAEGLAGAVYEQISIHIARGAAGELPELVPQFMFMIVRPYLGYEAALEELQR